MDSQSAPLIMKDLGQLTAPIVELAQFFLVQLVVDVMAGIVRVLTLMEVRL